MSQAIEPEFIVGPLSKTLRGHTPSLAALPRRELFSSRSHPKPKWRASWSLAGGHEVRARVTSSPRQLGRHAFRRAARDVEVDCATCMIWRRQHRHRQRRACARTGLRRELLPTNNSDRQEDVASGRRVRKTATAALSLTSAIGWHRVCSTLMLVSVSHCAQSQVQDAPGLIGAWVRVHPHDAPLEREGVRRNNAKNESGLLPKFQNDECLSSMRAQRWGRETRESSAGLRQLAGTRCRGG